MATGPAPAAMARAASTRRRSSTTTSGTPSAGIQRDQRRRSSSSDVAVRRPRRRREVLEGFWCSGVHRSNLGDGRRRSAPRPGQRDDALRAAGAAPRSCRAGRPTPAGGRRSRRSRRPGGADLHLDLALAVGEPGEALGDHAGDRAGLGGVAAARAPSRASVSQVQPTAPSIGSLASSGSSSARANVTARHAPSHGSGADGSCSSTNRPRGQLVVVLGGAERPRRSRATAYGAMRCGAGTSVRRTSGRSRAARRSARACANSADGLARDASTRHPMQRYVVRRPRGEAARRDTVRRCWRCSPSARALLWGTARLLRRAALADPVPRGGGRLSQACRLRRAQRRRPAPGRPGLDGWPVLGVAAGVAGSVGLVGFYAALSTGTMGVVAPVAALGAAVPVLLGVATGDQPGRRGVGRHGRRGRSARPWRPAPSSPAGAPAGRCCWPASRPSGFGFACSCLDRGARVSLLHTLWGMRLASVGRLLRRGARDALGRGRGRAGRAGAGSDRPRRRQRRTRSSPSPRPAGWSASPASWARSTRWRPSCGARPARRAAAAGAARRRRAGARGVS